jgi:SAM-dependent methyltransferase
MREAGSWQKRWFDRFYNDRPGWVDGTTTFHRMAAAAIDALRKPARRDARLRILEIGSGPANPTSRFLAGLGELHGIDPDPLVRANDALTSATQLGEDGVYPFESGRFDACVSDYVVEHVADPVAHLVEVERVLVPGGLYLFRTPNRWHPISLISAATPHWFHRLVANRLRGLADEAHDPYPTLYRMNTRASIARAAAAAGLAIRELRMIEPDPSYGRSSRVLFLAFAGYERLVNSTDWLAGIRINILAVLEKRDEGPI